MSTCPQCGEAVSAGDAFCPSCDAALPPFDPNAGLPQQQSAPATGGASTGRASRRPRADKTESQNVLDIYGRRGTRADTCQKCKRRSVVPGETFCASCSEAALPPAEADARTPPQE